MILLVVWNLGLQQRQSKLPRYITDVRVIDGAAAVHFLSVGELRTFGIHVRYSFCTSF